MFGQNFNASFVSMSLLAPGPQPPSVPADAAARDPHEASSLSDWDVFRGRVF